MTISMEDLKKFEIKFNWTFPYTGLVHGIAGWFDIDLCGEILTTAPSCPHTHWQQVRFLFQEPLAMNAYETLNGVIKFDVNSHRSYDIDCNCGVAPLEDLETKVSRLSVEGCRRRHDLWKLHEQTYWYDTNQDYTRPETHGMYAPHIEDMDVDGVSLSDITSP
jgi:histone-arginine methyltransferase CARM1